MKNIVKNIIITIACIILGGLYLFITYYFDTVTCDVVAQNPTEEQILALFDYSGDVNRIWLEDIEKI
ncbi:hypothetical protein LCGC14_2405610 [marine sediment metagenome]|uniref:Uncharacterized protein n=1 Tax=marine sediment metagenome TaxID=412755 RepID=A0A0F9BU03_9ZZZZ